MSNRHKIVKESRESEAFESLRKESGLSIRKLADRMGISKTRVQQFESGRGNITDEYVDNFLIALKLTKSDWLYEVGDCSEYDELKVKCHSAIDELRSDELKKLYEFMRDYLL